MARNNVLKTLLVCASIVTSMVYSSSDTSFWESAFVKINKAGTLTYIPDEKGNIIPDFSKVGYYGGDKPIPDIPVVKTVSSTGTDNDQNIIQTAIDEVSKRSADKNGFRGTVLIKKVFIKFRKTSVLKLVA